MVQAPERTHSPRRRFRSLALLSGAAAIALLAAGCAGGSSSASNGEFGFPETEQQADSTITVWVDNTRVAAADAFKAANPDVPIDVVTYDGSANGSNSFQTKIQLFDKAKKGWPDVVWSTQTNDAAWASQTTPGSQPFAAQLDGGLVDSELIDGFTPGSLDPCTVDGKVYCLRNDLAQNVLWYDKTLFDQFGYTLPTTWEEYQELGEKVASEHPGYIIGAAGDAWTPEIYMWASKCQAGDVTAVREITVDTTSEECQRMADLLDTTIANGSVTTESVFSPSFVQKYAGKVLAMPGPVWYSGAIFNSPDSLNVPAGQIGAATPLTWDGEDVVTGNVGGGTWYISSHSANLASAKKFVEFAATSDEYQVELNPGLPAFAAAGEKWVAKQADSGYFAGDLSALTDSASLVWSGWGSPTFSQEAVWAKTVTPVITSGGTVSDTLEEWGQAIKDQAQVNGYKVG
ncbi:extracellular solute-binding protein [Herbiconiux sp. VKM Ac-1786]|uniref:ABC transporter substrate-binding protein n=1 Tax=Herbiconiux sp. VKM Ac-1786 TaxID=2783824 RepID=UPI00188AF0C4|nr:extracellular solute-binding protein [Herbiconiux sp. VKM Ac-1786]MBF4572735.1 extracellular solute-binding protein [Herbiconiux sp. VKM Ac-1786]